MNDNARSMVSRRKLVTTGSIRLMVSCCLAFLFCCPYLSAQTTATTVIQGPGTFRLGSFNSGDQVTVSIQTRSCDPNESGENEPVVVFSSTPDYFASIGTYGTIQTDTFKATAAGSLSGFISGSDTNTTFCGSPGFDEEGIVTVTVAQNCSQTIPPTIPTPPGCPIRGWTQGQKDFATQVSIVSATIGGIANVGKVLGALCPPPGEALCVATIQFASIGLVFANAELAFYANKEPPDPNFMVIAQPMIPTLTPVVAGNGITPAVAAALNALNTNDVKIIAYSQAGQTSADRAAGAANAGNAFWEAAQFQAELNYGDVLVSLIAFEPGLLANLQSAFVAGGYPSVTVTASDVVASETAILQNGLPASIVQVLTQAGLSNDTITLLQNFLDALDANKVAGTFPAKLTDPSLASAVKNFVNSLVIPVGPGLCIPFPVILPTLAGPTGAFVTLTSSDPLKVTLGPGNGSSETIFIAAGATAPITRMPNVCGVNFGSATVTALGGGLSSSQVVQVTATLSFSPASSTMTTARQDRLTLSLSAPAPAGGVTVNLSSDNQNVAIVPATVTIPPNNTSVVVPVTGVAAGSTLIHASALPDVPDTVASVTVM